MLGISLPKFPDVPQPPDIPGISIPPLTLANNPLQFQCRVMAMPVSGTPAPVVQVAMGSVTYSQSTMPFVKSAPFRDDRQAFINFAAVLSSGVAPVPLADATSPYMLGGGGYALTGTGRWYVTLTKWDVSAATALGPLLNLELPWVSIVKDDSDQFDALFVDTGPSLYENQTNIQKMEGYQDYTTVGESTFDWGHCHTTWFNPRFFGNANRVIAIIDSVPAVPSTVAVAVLREGGPTFGNELQTVTFLGQYNSGTVTFTYNSVTTTTAFNPSTQNAYDLQICLNTIPALSGNVFVQQSAPGVYQIEFSNILRNVNVSTLVVNSSLTSFTTWYKVTQMHVGSQDIVIPCELNATFLMNKEGLTEAEDPYNLNAGSIPPWEDIVNIEDARTVSLLGFIPAFATPIINDAVPRAFGRGTVPVYGDVAGCDGDASDHPFKVIHVETDGGDSTYRIVSGTVNNVVPGNIGSEITVLTDEYEVWLKVPYASGAFPATSGFEWNLGTPVPPDTDAEGYVRVATVNGATVTQYITGSLWGDRIKLGTQTATYYYARV
jgi:hypothetical protein